MNPRAYIWTCLCECLCVSELCLVGGWIYICMYAWHGGRNGRIHTECSCTEAYTYCILIKIHTHTHMCINIYIGTPGLSKPCTINTHRYTSLALYTFCFRHMHHQNMHINTCIILQYTRSKHALSCKNCEFGDEMELFLLRLTGRKCVGKDS